MHRVMLCFEKSFSTVTLQNWVLHPCVLAVGISRDRRENYVNLGSHIGAGDNSVSNHSKPYDKDNILHCLFSLEKIVKMPC